MILRNYYKIFDMLIQGDKIDNLTIFKTTSGGEGHFRYYNSNGDSGCIDCLGFHLTSLRDSVTSSGIVLGDGTTEPTFDDYSLSGSVIKGLSGTVVRTGTNDGDGSAIATFLMTLTNSNANDVTIGEIGYIGSFTARYTNGTNSVTAYIFLERTVLDTPITIPAGGIGQVTYTIRMNYPTA